MAVYPKLPKHLQKMLGTIEPSKDGGFICKPLSRNS